MSSAAITFKCRLGFTFGDDRLKPVVAGFTNFEPRRRVVDFGEGFGSPASSKK